MVSCLDQIIGLSTLVVRSAIRNFEGYMDSKSFVELDPLYNGMIDMTDDYSITLHVTGSSSATAAESSTCRLGLLEVRQLKTS
jgi:hypothetical protein